MLTDFTTNVKVRPIPSKVKTACASCARQNFPYIPGVKEAPSQLYMVEFFLDGTPLCEGCLRKLVTEINSVLNKKGATV